MKPTIRAQLALWYMLALAAALALVLGVLALEMKRQFEEENKRALRTEERWLTTLFESRFLGLRTTQDRAYAALDSTLHEELEERYGLKRQFALIAVQRGDATVVFHGGLKKAAELLPNNFWERGAGNYDLLLDNRRYRVRVFEREWGKVIVGGENETLYRVAQEAGEVLVWIFPLALALALAGGWMMAKLAMRPVLSAARAAETFSLTNLHERLPAYSGKDEFGHLVATLNRMIARLEEGVARLQQFTQDAAHELRTPLTILRGDLELAYQNETSGEDTRAVLQKTLDRVIGLSQIIDNLMLLARSDAGAYPLRPARFRFDGMVKEIFEDVKILAEERGLAACLPECEELDFFGDELLLRRLLLNLCDNAVKYTAQGTIELRLRRAGEAVEFELRDTGLGIPAEDLPHIFDRFYRVDKSRTSATGGSGLGLAICKWIVAAHRGELTLTSTAGLGTQVVVRMPNAAAPRNGANTV